MAATVSTRLWIGVKCCATNKVRTRPVTWIYVDGRGRDLQTLVTDIQAVIAREVKLPPGVSVSYTGQFEFLVRSEEHTSELQSLMRISYAVFCLKIQNKHQHAETLHVLH